MSMLARIGKTLGVHTEELTTDQLLLDLSKHGEVCLFGNGIDDWSAVIKLPPAFQGAEARIRTDYRMTSPRAALEQLWARLQQVGA